MAANKRFFWMKLYEDFFQQTIVRYLRKMPSGDRIVIIYQELLLSSIRTDGYICTEKLYPTVEEDVALRLDEDLMDVKLAMQVLEQAGLLELGSGEWDIHMTEFSSMVGFGSETASTQRSRDYRRRKKPGMIEVAGISCVNEPKLALPDNGVALQQDCNTSASTPQPDRNFGASPRQQQGNTCATARQQESDADIDIDKELEIDTEKDIDNKYKLYGRNRNVRLTKYQYETLQTLFKRDYLLRIDRLSDYMVKTGKEYSDHYITIINWSRYELERKLKKTEETNRAGFEDYSFQEGESY